MRRRSFIGFSAWAVLLLILGGGAQEVQAKPKAPALRELKSILKTHKTAINRALALYKSDIKDIQQLGTSEEGFFLTELATEFAQGRINDAAEAAEAAIAEVCAAHPELCIEGVPGGELTRTLDAILNEVQCVVAKMVEALTPLLKIREGAVFVRISVRIDVVVVPPPPPPPVVAPPKPVKVQWYAAGRLSSSANDRVTAGGQAPAGATVNVTLDCGGGNVTTVAVVADQNCRWRARFNNVPPGACTVTATDAGNAANSGKKNIGVP